MNQQITPYVAPKKDARKGCFGLGRAVAKSTNPGRHNRGEYWITPNLAIKSDRCDRFSTETRIFINATEIFYGRTWLSNREVAREVYERTKGHWDHFNAGEGLSRDKALRKIGESIARMSEEGDPDSLFVRTYTKPSA